MSERDWFVNFRFIFLHFWSFFIFLRILGRVWNLQTFRLSDSRAFWNFRTIWSFRAFWNFRAFLAFWWFRLFFRRVFGRTCYASGGSRPDFRLWCFFRFCLYFLWITVDPFLVFLARISKTGSASPLCCWNTHRFSVLFCFYCYFSVFYHNWPVINILTSAPFFRAPRTGYLSRKRN